MENQETPLSGAIISRILQLCEERKLSVNALAGISGLSSSSLKSILYHRSRNPTVKTVKILCDGLDISLKEFFDSPLFDALEQEIL